jgi:hypothetical protein
MEFSIASKADQSAIVALHAQSWREAYKTILSADNLHVASARKGHYNNSSISPHAYYRSTHSIKPALINAVRQSSRSSSFKNSPIAMVWLLSARRSLIKSIGLVGLVT